MTESSYFDSSALVKRYIAEVGSNWVQDHCNNASRTIALADIGRVEVAAAFASKLRSKAITQVAYQRVKGKLAADVQQKYQILPITAQRIDEAIILTARHKLRGYDAVHLACALYLNQTLLVGGYSPIIFVAADTDLLQAAQTEGLFIENPNLYPSE